MPKLRHYDHLGTARFITFTCYRRHQYLSHLFARQAMLNELAHMREKQSVKILGYVIMPEHVHLLLIPPDNTRLGGVIGRLKARSARLIFAQLESEDRKSSPILVRSDGSRAIWQRRCHDHNCRTPEIVIEKLKYCHENPVKQGLVSNPADWPWSSNNWYHSRKEGVFEIDGFKG